MDSYLRLPSDADAKLGSITRAVRTALAAFNGDELQAARQRGHDVTIASYIIQNGGTLLERLRQAISDGIKDALTLAPESAREELARASHANFATAMEQLQASMPGKATRIREVIQGQK